ncbi:MAG: ATP-dependent Clp protease adaptor ClpS [Planctomycetota bacterium]|nr:ATP-dependent Clp protease adaptor ClpS [Planctomycetota bacterium]
MSSGSTTVVPEVEERTALAPPWKVLLLNDDITTFEFVIWLLMTLFAKPRIEAIALTVEIHETGAALVATTNFERAELYVEQVRSLARPHGYPLAATMEPA